MTTLRTNQNLPQVQATNVKLAKPNEDKKLTLEKRVKLVEAGEEKPEAVLADFGIKNPQIKQIGKNKFNFTCEVNGKSVNITSTSIEDLKEKSAFVLGNEIDNQGGNEEPATEILLIILGLIAVAAIAYYCGHKDKPKEPLE